MDTGRQRFAISPAVMAGQSPFGPFRVLSDTEIEMVGAVDADTPIQFARLLQAMPGLKRLTMRDCPGALDDRANFALARLVRAAGMSTFVPADGSIRSAAVDLFLAGVEHVAAPGAEMGVHAWRDEQGRDAATVPADDPAHAGYLAYYREMGMDAERAQAFYAMANATPFDSIRYLSRADIAAFALSSDD